MLADATRAQLLWSLIGDELSVNDLAERAAQLRILARGAGHHVARLHEFARLAEASMSESHPQQALAAIATALRRAEVDAVASQNRLQRAAELQLDALLAHYDALAEKVGEAASFVGEFATGRTSR